jgi:hypothetical protein
MKNVITLITISLFVFSSCSKKGCVDSTACNYDSEAKKDDESCTYATMWYEDLDGDGNGNSSVSLSACDQPSGYVSNSTDEADLLVVQQQRATVTYVGATWCPPCGAYGDPTKEHMESAHGSNVVILNCQSGDAISNSGEFGPEFGGAFQGFVGSNSIPHGYWSAANVAMDHRGFYTSATANNSAADDNINAITSSTVDVGVAASATISGETVTVNTLTKFYSDQGEHHIGVYLLEDGIDAEQQISGSNAAITAHNNVLTTAAYTSNTIGAESLGSSFSANQEVSGTYTIPVYALWNSSNLQVAVVIWKSTNADGISNSILVDVN